MPPNLAGKPGAVSLPGNSFPVLRLGIVGVSVSIGLIFAAMGARGLKSSAPRVCSCVKVTVFWLVSFSDLHRMTAESSPGHGH
jgi:hypothetical protein